MAFDYLEELEEQINRGVAWYCCPGKAAGDWHLAKTADELNEACQTAANLYLFEQSIYKLKPSADSGGEDRYFVCKKILEPGARGEPNLHWMIVDTKDAAELLRDVSQGPSPYFGATVVKSCQPKGGGQH
ncbi:MAG: hypothetical protein KDD66_02350 [Bdellovibrionales bacterium]|nr:hypothetical protein [Bdellovibrionales bacterium]